MNRPNWSQRRTLVIAAVLVIVLALLASITFAGLGPGPRPSVVPSAAVAQVPLPTVPQLIMQGHADRDGLLDFEGALEMFSYAFRPLPGVSLPSGPADSTHSWTDLAMSSILPHASELTDAQRAVVASYLVPAKAAAGRPGTAGGIYLAAYLASADPAKVQPGIEGYVTLALSAEAHRLGHTVADAPVGAGPGAVRIVLVSQDVADSSAGGAPAWTIVSHGPMTVGAKGEFLFDTTGNVTNCTIFFGPSAWASADASGGWAPDELQVAEVYHEVFHCYQGFVIGSKTAAAAYATPAWVTEGGADWAASSATGFDEPAWTTYLSTPGKPLAQRAYDAFGLYFEMEYVGGPLWPDWWKVWTAASSGGWGITDWFNGIAGDRLDAVRKAWAASYYQDESLGHDWTEVVSGQTTKAWDISVPFDGALNRFTEPYSTLQVDIPPQSDGTVVVAYAFGASARWIDHVHTEAVDAPQTTMCWGNGTSCTCPGGGGLGADQAVSVIGGVSWAMTSLQDVGNAVLTRYTHDQYCKQKNPCGPNCSNSNGDPHLLTVNRYRYDFQAAGEFTLLRSADGSVDIQVRQEPWGSVGNVSINTAVAAKVGSHRVAVYAGGGTLQAKVDGVAADLASPMDFGGGGRISTSASGFEIDFPDGTKMWTLSVGKWGINAQISPSTTLRTSGVGLLGPTVPGGLGVPALPDGTRLPAAVDSHARHNAVYGQFADAWRVSDSTTLFDYDAGKSTATYTVRNYPADAADIPPGDLTAAQKAAGEAACTAITDPDLHTQCVFDVGVTGQTGFAASYQATQTFSDSGIVQATPAPGTPGPAYTISPLPAPSGAVDGALQVVQGTRLGGFALGPDNMLYISVEVSSGHSILVEVDPTSGKILHQVDVPALTDVHVVGGAVWLPGLVTDTNGDRCSVTRFDASTLAQGATIALPCSPQTPQIASDGSAIWFVDTTKYDVPSKKGAVLTRIDPATNALGPSVALPSDSGRLEDSQGAVFFLDTGSDRGSYRLTSGASAMDSLGQFNVQPVVAAGPGLWVTSADGQSAEYFKASGTPQVTLPIPGKLVSGDATAAYVDVLGQDSTGTRASDQLWRYPIDGSEPTLLAYAPVVNGEGYSYSSAFQPLPVANGRGVALVLSENVSGSKTPWVILQWTPLK